METTLLKNVKRLCAEKHMELKELANIVEVDTASLSRSLRNDTRLSTVIKIANALSVSVQTLITKGDIVEGWLMINGKAHYVHSREELSNFCHPPRMRNLFGHI